MRPFLTALRRGAVFAFAGLLALSTAARAQPVPPGTTLTIGDPQIAFALRLPGNLNKLPLSGK